MLYVNNYLNDFFGSFVCAQNICTFISCDVLLFFLQHTQNGYFVRTCKFLERNLQADASPCKFLPETCKFLQGNLSHVERLSCKSLVSRMINLKVSCKSNG